MSKDTAASRLMKEFQSLQKNPIAGANAHPVEDNLLQWKLIVVGEAPYDFPIRIQLDYSNEYPNVAPKAYFETSMPFTGGASMIDAKTGLQSVCLNIFANFNMYHSEWKTAQAGWTPAYTIETIITSIQGLMMEEMLSKRPADVEAARTKALNFKCAVTGHDGAEQGKWWPAVSFDPSKSKKAEGGEEGEEKDEESEEVKQQKRDAFEIDNTFLCYVLKGCPEDKKLGFGIAVEGFKTKSFTTTCEILSKEAFTKMKVRNSSTNKPFQVWIPLITPYISSFDLIQEDFYAGMQMLARIAAAEGIPAEYKGDTDPSAAENKSAKNPRGYGRVSSPIHICFSIMNSLVVEVMNSGNNLTANDKFIEGYFAILKLLSHHVTKYPDAGAYVDRTIKAFVDKPEKRVKEFTPNLGEFLLYPLLSTKYRWEDIAQPFLTESDVRCVFWYAVGTRHQPAKYPDLKRQDATNRAGKVFEATEISRRLVCYQVKFSNMGKSFIRSLQQGPPPAAKLNDEQQQQQQPAKKGSKPPLKILNHATELVTEEAKQQIKNNHKVIVEQKNWADYYKFLNVKQPENVDALLRAAVESSRKVGYHR